MSKRNCSREVTDDNKKRGIILPERENFIDAK
jgi:hypothetical protein